MCGINGIFAYHYAAGSVDRAELLKSRDHMAPRGPDGSGAWFSDDSRVGLGHRRLAIIDLTEAGAQPMAGASGTTVLTFNGEIYNYRELRGRLEAKGRVFRSHSDTEVLLHLYEEKGSDMVHDLRGMFAFAIWDGRLRQLFLARDPFGIKPLYYADDGWMFRFASQVKALRAGGAISGDPDPAGWTGFYLWGSIPEPYTQFSAVRSLPAGCHMRVDAIGARAPVRYHSVAAVYRAAENAPLECGDAQEWVRAALLDSVQHHLVADVPVGVFLSSGIDSCALLGLMRDASHEMTESVTLSFEEFQGSEQDEGVLAAEVARLYGARHTTYVVTRSEFEADLPRIAAAMDTPTIDGINSWFVSKAAAALGLKVAISGLGGDELFGGYPSFRDVPRWVKRCSLLARIPGSGLAMRKLGSTTLKLGANFNPKTAGMLSLGGSYPGAYLLRRGIYMPWEIDAILDVEMVREGMRRLGRFGGAERALDPSPDTPFGKVAALETELYMRNQLLRDTDWASMAHSLEVRVPLVDAKLLKTAAPILVSGAISREKRVLGAAPAMPLPPVVMNRPKSGFTTPIASWQQFQEGLGIPARARNSVANTPSALPWARRWALHVAYNQAAQLC